MGKTFVDGDVLTANDANTYLQAIASIVPSVSGSGVSVDTSSGLVSFTTATSVIVSNAFTSDYRNYRINMESTGTAANVVINLRAGSTNSITNYDRTVIRARNATVVSATSLNNASGNLIGFDNTVFQCDIEVSSPASEAPTTMISRAGVHANPAVSSTANGIDIVYHTHRPSEAYDGFNITYSAAQTGTIRIYGYN
jgi:hypothetical protein